MDGTTRILTNFWQAGLESNTSIGEAWVAARAQMAKEAAAHPGYHWVQSEINLLGDPTLAVRNADPIEPKLQTPKAIKIRQANNQGFDRRRRRQSVRVDGRSGLSNGSNRRQRQRQHRHHHRQARHTADHR